MWAMTMNACASSRCCRCCNLAGGIAVFDLRTKSLRWSAHLDLTTADTTLKAQVQQGLLKRRCLARLGGSPACCRSRLQKQLLFSSIRRFRRPAVAVTLYLFEHWLLLCNNDVCSHASVAALPPQMYAPPTLIDLDRDGKMEVVVGTSLGFLYVLDHQVRLSRSRKAVHIHAVATPVTC